LHLTQAFSSVELRGDFFLDDVVHCAVHSAISRDRSASEYSMLHLDVELPLRAARYLPGVVKRSV